MPRNLHAYRTSCPRDVINAREREDVFTPFLITATARNTVALLRNREVINIPSQTRSGIEAAGEVFPRA